MSARAVGTHPITEYVLGGLLAGFTMLPIGPAFIAGIHDIVAVRADPSK